MISIIPEEDVISLSKWIPITKAYKYEMKHTRKQEIRSNHTLSVCRYLYNDTLTERKNAWENGQWNVQYNDQQNYLPELRNENDKNSKYLQEVYAQVEQDVIRRVDKAYQNFFRRVKENKEGKNGSGNGDSYKKPGFPRFKGYGQYDSFTFPQYGYGCNIVDRRGKDDPNGNYIRLSKIGDIKFIKHREIGDPGIPYQIKTVTAKREIDKYFVVFTVETFIEIKILTDIYKKLDFKPLDNLIYNLFEAKRNKNNIYDAIKKEMRNLLIEISKLSMDNKEKEKGIKTVEELNEKCIGVDMGLSNLITMSNRKIAEHQKFLRKSEKRLAREQRKLVKKKREEKEIEIIDKEESKKASKIGSKKQGKKVDIEIKKKIKVKVNSKNREKQRIRVTKVHRKIVNQRRNFNHEISRTLVDNFDLIVFEKLNIQQMMKNRRYSKSIADASWYQLQMFTNYKAEWAGKLVDFVPSKNTTKECSKCHKTNDMPIWKRVMVCSCGNIEDRDIDASFVIRDRSVIYQELKRKVLEKISRSVNREVINSRDAIAQIQASGDETSTQIEMSERVLSVNQETLSSTKGGKLADTSMQAPPFRAG